MESRKRVLMNLLSGQKQRCRSRERTCGKKSRGRSNAWKWKVKVKSLSCVQLFAIPWTAAHQAPPSRQEYWSGLPVPSPSNLHPAQFEPTTPPMQALWPPFSLDCFLQANRDFTLAPLGFYLSILISFYSPLWNRPFCTLCHYTGFSKRIGPISLEALRCS